MLYDKADPAQVFARAFSGEAPLIARPVVREVAPDPQTMSKKEFMDKVAQSVLAKGTGYTAHKLRHMGLHPTEVRRLLDAVSSELRSYNNTDKDTHKAISLMRHEDMFFLAKSSMNVEGALSALRQIDKITGVVKSGDDEGMAAGDLADLAGILDVEGTVEEVVETPEEVDVNADAIAAWVDDEEPTHPDEV